MGLFYLYLLKLELTLGDWKIKSVLEMMQRCMNPGLQRYSYKTLRLAGGQESIRPLALSSVPREKLKGDRILDYGLAQG